MLVLFDKNVPFGTRRFLRGHAIVTVQERGWERITNGELITLSEAAGIDVVVTADQNVVYQQNLKNRRISLVVIGSNIWPIVQLHGDQIREQVEAATSGSYAFVEMPLPPRPPRRP